MYSCRSAYHTKLVDAQQDNTLQQCMAIHADVKLYLYKGAPREGLQKSVCVLICLPVNTAHYDWQQRRYAIPHGLTGNRR